MGLFTDIMQSLIDDLNAQQELKQIKFMMAYSPIKKANPITTPTVTIGFGGVDLTEGAMGDFIGTNSYGELFGKSTTLKLNMKLYSPHKLGGEACSETFDKICSSLLFGNIENKPFKINSNSITYSTSDFAFILNSEIYYKFMTANQIESSPVSDIIVKGVY